MLHHMGSPVKPLLCVFSTIKLNCDVVEKLEQCPVQQTQQQTLPYCPTFGQTHSHTHTHTKRTRTHREHAVWHRYGRGGGGVRNRGGRKKCCSEQLCSVHIIWLKGFVLLFRVVRTPVTAPNWNCVCARLVVYVCECLRVCTNQLICSPRQSYEKTDNYIRSLLTIFACRKVSSAAQLQFTSFIPC